MAKGGFRGKGWKRGARPGNYTDMQWNIACRVTQMGFPSGPILSEVPGTCPATTQARISLGYLPYGTCGKTVGPSSPCAGVRGPNGLGGTSRASMRRFGRIK